MPEMLLLEEIIFIPAIEPESASSATVPLKREVLSPQLPHRSFHSDAVVDDEKLTKLSSTHRPPRLPELPPHITPGASFPTTAAISSSLNYDINNICQDVHSEPLNSVSSLSRSPVIQHAPLSSTPFESPLQTFHSSPSNGPVNSPSSSLRTPVFHNHEQLVAFCQLPTQLPPPPRVHRSASDPLAQFHQLKNNYLKMLSKKSNDTTSDVVTTMPDMEQDSMLMPPPPAVEQASQPLTRDVMESPLSDFFPSPEFTSPEFLTSPNFLTSPMDDSPFPDYLSTPMLTDVGCFDTSPIISTEEFPDLGFGHSLFPEFDGWDVAPEAAPAPGEVKKNHLEVKQQLSTPMLDDLYAISPATSDTHSFPSESPAPQQQSMPTARRSSGTKPIGARRTKTGPTGTRKNITPDALVPVDAPIQPRNYQSPSSTSRKEVPAVFLRKRVRSQAFDEEEELADLPPDATEKEQIEHKRRQNTLAARKSRKRKLEHQLYLEDKVEQQEREIERWRTRAITYQKMLTQHGVAVPAFDD